MMERIPQINTRIDIGTLGFYEYMRSLKCPLGGLSEHKVLKSGSLPEGLPTKNQIVGNIYHELMDNVYKYASKSDFIKFSQDLISRYEAKYANYLKDNKLGSIKSWSAVTNSVRHALESINNRSIESNGKICKGLISTPNGLFMGVADKLVIDGNIAYLTEYKSTDLFLNGEINDEYLEQIKFYSYIILSRYPIVERIIFKIQSMNGGYKDGEFKAEDLLEYAEYIENKYNEIKEKITSNPTKFDIDYCRFCRKSIICNDYRLNNITQEANDAIYLISEMLQSIDIGNNSSKLKFQSFDINIPNQILSKYNFILGTRYTIYRLDKSGPNLNWVNNTVIYEH